MKIHSFINSMIVMFFHNVKEMWSKLPFLMKKNDNKKLIFRFSFQVHLKLVQRHRKYRSLENFRGYGLFCAKVPNIGFLEIS